MCVLDLSLNFFKLEYFWGHKIFKMELLDNFKQASKQKKNGRILS